ncbi:hypothetical protein ACF061_23950 [Streptomyces sp. NPDC015220]|uniref:hypothetical protein n=1 Tax=Streptomyces sp. NPDC015220 TaxID=3364947 RepID=UPI0036FEE2A2
MGGLLSELGKALAERWLSLLALPGALFLAVAGAAHELGQAHPFRVHRLVDAATAATAHPAARSVGGQIILLAMVLAGAAAAGLTAQALGSLVERLLLAADWPSWPPVLRQWAARRTLSRQLRWDSAAQEYDRLRELAARSLAAGRRADPAARHAAEQRMSRIAAERPRRPTWCGNRIDAVAVRLDRDHGIDLAVVWPQLWLVMPEESRTQVVTAREDLARAAALFGWSLVYLPLTVWWWPAAAVSIILAVIGNGRVRATADAYALLVEAAAHLHLRTLADHLGLEYTGPMSPEDGDRLTNLLRPPVPPRPRVTLPSPASPAGPGDGGGR